jgi:PhzF family phenazine biosynthesis protein
MKRARPFMQVDVFGTAPMMGNPVAVVLDGEGLSDTAMQDFARWTNVSETTFVLPPSNLGADYALRIFTPASELPFAGHPTLGSAHAVMAAGIAAPREGRLVQQCAKGLIAVRVGEGELSLTMPPAAIAPAPEPERLEKALGTALVAAPQVVDVGPRWVVAEVAEWDTLHALTPDYAALAAYDRAHGVTGQSLFAGRGDAAGTILVRSFAAGDSINEDPVCGSGNGAVAAYRLANGAIGEGGAYTAVQGLSVGRNGHVALRVVDGGIEVGGACAALISGTVTI